MENIYWAIILWASLFALVPLKRIKELWPAALIGFALSFLINYLLVTFGYVQFTKYIAIWAGVPPFHTVGVAAAGILAVNWLNRNLIDKIIIVFLMSVLLIAAKFVMISVGAVRMLDGYNYYWSFAVNIAGVSLHVWLSILVLGKEKVYGGNKSRLFTLKSKP